MPILLLLLLLQPTISQDAHAQSPSFLLRLYMDPQATRESTIAQIGAILNVGDTVSRVMWARMAINSIATFPFDSYTKCASAKAAFELQGFDASITRAGVGALAKTDTERWAEIGLAPPRSWSAIVHDDDQHIADDVVMAIAEVKGGDIQAATTSVEEIMEFGQTNALRGRRIDAEIAASLLLSPRGEIEPLKVSLVPPPSDGSWKVILHDDDRHTFEEVVTSIAVASGLTIEESTEALFRIGQPGNEQVVVLEGRHDAAHKAAAALAEGGLDAEFRGPCGQWQLELFDDDEHTYPVVIKAIQQAAGVSELEAVWIATAVGRAGSTVVLQGTRGSVLKGQRELEMVGLKTRVTQPLDRWRVILKDDDEHALMHVVAGIAAAANITQDEAAERVIAVHAEGESVVMDVQDRSSAMAGCRLFRSLGLKVELSPPRDAVWQVFMLDDDVHEFDQVVKTLKSAVVTETDEAHFLIDEVMKYGRTQALVGTWKEAQAARKAFEQIDLRTELHKTPQSALWQTTMYDSESTQYSEAVSAVMAALSCNKETAEGKVWQVHSKGQAVIVKGREPKAKAVEGILLAHGMDALAEKAYQPPGRRSAVLVTDVWANRDGGSISMLRSDLRDYVAEAHRAGCLYARLVSDRMDETHFMAIIECPEDVSPPSPSTRPSAVKSVDPRLPNRWAEPCDELDD